MTWLPADSFVFDSESWPEDQRFERYRELYSGGADVLALDAPFLAQVNATRLDGAVLYRRRLRGVGHERPEARLPGDGFDHLTITAVVKGRFEIATGTAFHEVPPGAIVVFDMTRPMRNRAHDAEILTVSLARSRFGLAWPDQDSIHGKILTSTAAAFLVDYLQLSSRYSQRFDIAFSRTVTETLLRHVAAALHEPAHISRGEPPLANANRARLIEMIDAMLGNPGFGERDLVAETGISRATVYRTLRDLGGAAEYIRRRRLRRIRIALASSDDSLEELAARNGFPSASQCSSAFLRCYGMRPGEYRRRVREGEQRGLPGDQMQAWHEEVLPSKR